MFRFTRFLVLLFVLLLALMPVAAQEVFLTNTPAGVEVVATQEAPAPETLIPASLVDELYQNAIGQMSIVIVIVLGIGAVVLLGVSVPAFYYIYQSVPKAFQPMIQQGALGALELVEGRLRQQYESSKNNGIDWDDDVWLALYNEAVKNREKIAAVGQSGAVG